MNTATITGGEKAFTPKARAKVVKRLLKLAEKEEAEARANPPGRDARHLAAALAKAATLQDLLDAVEEFPDLGYDNNVLDRNYYQDYRSVCSFCHQKAFGGWGYPDIDGNDRFACWRKPCQKKADVEDKVATDRRSLAWKKHAKHKGVCAGCSWKKPKPDFRNRGRTVKTIRRCKVCRHARPLYAFWAVSSWMLAWKRPKAERKAAQKT